MCALHKENFTDFNEYFLIPSYLNTFNAQKGVKKNNNYIGLEIFKLILCYCFKKSSECFFNGEVLNEDKIEYTLSFTFPSFEQNF